MNNEVKELMKVLKPILTFKAGNIQTNEDGENYKYDLFIHRPEGGYNMPYFIKVKFERALKSLDLNTFEPQFKVDNYTFTILKNTRGKILGVSVDKFILLNK